ncbi:hypothetical protein [Hoeflea sp.]|uniref:hypothetical protein n=1 Tax=Hoeflea sp. TaxID=1940281 RepID=UPI0019B5E6DE|nr:hypothetical protein [Hoeflea sp.]MBC7279887.1 hypothetical protein [Hoeflea sp.]
MSHTASDLAPAMPEAGQPVSMTKTKFAAFLTAIGAIVLIGSEIWLAAIGAMWAVHGYFDTGMIGDIILIAMIAPMALWATWMTAKLAIAAELNPENAD